MPAITADAPRCPRCQRPLRPLIHAGERIEVCPECLGLWCDAEGLAGLAGAAAPPEVHGWSPEPGSIAGSPSCPRGHGPMRQVSLDAGLPLPQCVRCGGIWVDRGALPPVFARLSPVASDRAERLRVLDEQIQEIRYEEDERRVDFVERTIESRRRHWIFQFLFGLPMEVYHPVRSRPLATYALIAVNVLVFIVQLSSPDLLIRQYGLIPVDFLGHVAPWTLLTSMFMHGGLAHLFGNMYFLKVFGDNVEDRLGSGEYLALYLLGGAVATLAHIASDASSVLPVIGASGAVSAVMGAYLFLFPHRRLYTMIFFRLIRLRAVWYLGFYLVIQLVYAGTGVPGVAWWAHAGGFAFGLAAAALHRTLLRRRLAAVEKTAG